MAYELSKDRIGAAGEVSMHPIDRAMGFGPNSSYDRSYIFRH